MILLGCVTVANVLLQSGSVDYWRSLSQSLMSTNHQVKETEYENIMRDDGCGFVSNQTNRAKWIPYEEEDLLIYQQIDPCVRRLDNLQAYSVRKNATLYKLYCHIEISRNDVLATLANYDRVYLQGDSLLRQQFYGLICIIDPNVTRAQIPGKNIRMQYNYTHEHGTTAIVMKYINGFEDDSNLVANAYTTPATTEATELDAIVWNAAAHYLSYRANQMQSALELMRDTVTNASIFYMEPAVEQWPSSNGLYTKPCKSRCPCEPVTEERLNGRGSLSGPVDYEQGETHLIPDEEVFRTLYPHHKYLTLFAQRNGSSASDCIPDCLPASWRVDLSRKILSNHTTSTIITMVPTWWQLYALGSQTGYAHTRRPGDCTHLDVSTILATNQQLIRSMMMQQEKKLAITTT